MTAEASDDDKKLIVLIGNPERPGGWAGAFAQLALRVEAAHLILDPYASIADRRKVQLDDMTTALLVADLASSGKGTATAQPESRQARRAREREALKPALPVRANSGTVTRHHRGGRGRGR